MCASAVFVVIPVYNETATIRSVVEQVLCAGHNVVVVDDGSLQPVHRVVQDLPIAIIRHRFNLGQGAALETGTRYAVGAGAEFILHFDADGQHQVQDIEPLLSPLRNGNTDVVFGSRFLHPNPTIPTTRRWLLQTARWVNYCFTGLLLSDAHNGLRALNRRAAMQIKITENRMSHSSQILMLVKQQQLRFCEVPVQILYNDYSLGKGQTGWNSLRILFDLLLHKLFK